MGSSGNLWSASRLMPISAATSTPTIAPRRRSSRFRVAPARLAGFLAPPPFPVDLMERLTKDSVGIMLSPIAVHVVRRSVSY